MISHKGIPPIFFHFRIFIPVTFLITIFSMLPPLKRGSILDGATRNMIRRLKSTRLRPLLGAGAHHIHKVLYFGNKKEKNPRGWKKMGGV